MDSFDRIEERREATVGLAYEASLDRDYGDEDDAYEANDPKSPGFHDRAADAWDLREGK